MSDFFVLRSLRLGVRTPGFHPGNRGSIPLGTAKARSHKEVGLLFFGRVKEALNDKPMEAFAGP